MDPQVAELPLRDIHASPMPPFWPPAPGWWVLAFVALLVLVWATFKLWQRYRRWRFRQALEAELAGLMARHAADRDNGALARDASTLLRRLIVHVAGRRDAAAWTGERWTRLLAEAAGEDHALREASAAFASAPYARQPRVEPEAVQQLITQWIARSVREARHA